MECCTVVTGAASGIGYAVVQKLLAKGARVVAVDLNGERLHERLGDNQNVTCIACDLTNAEGFKLITDGIKAQYLGVKGFVHAAGFDRVAPLGMINAEAVAQLVSIHATFPIQFLGWMAKKNNHVDGAASVLISSLSTHEGAKGHVAYAAAKGAVEGLLKPAAAELAPKGIRLNAVVLGVVQTEMSQGWISKLTPDQFASISAGYPMGLGKPSDVANAIAFLLSADSSWITGQTLVCDGGHGVA